jgi:hypothetical protein
MAADNQNTQEERLHFIYNLYVKTVDFNPWIIGWVQQTPILGPYLVLSGTMCIGI